MCNYLTSTVKFHFVLAFAHKLDSSPHRSSLKNQNNKRSAWPCWMCHKSINTDTITVWQAYWSEGPERMWGTTIIKGIQYVTHRQSLDTTVFMLSQSQAWTKLHCAKFRLNKSRWVEIYIFSICLWSWEMEMSFIRVWMRVFWNFHLICKTNDIHISLSYTLCCCCQILAF